MYYPTWVLQKAQACGDITGLIRSFKAAGHCDIFLQTFSNFFLTDPNMSVQKCPQGHFVLLYFAAASSYTQKRSEALPAPLLATDLYTELEKKYVGIKEKVLGSCALTVNLEYIDLEDEEAKASQDRVVINEGDEVAVIPPVSSG